MKWYATFCAGAWALLGIYALAHDLVSVGFGALVLASGWTFVARLEWRD